MPTVSSPDGAYRDYQRSVGELEEEFQTELKRRDKASAERTRSLEERHRASLEERDESQNRELARIKETANEAVARERDLARSEIEKAKASTYDKFGRFQGNDADVTKQLLQEQVAASEAQRRHDRSALAAEEARSARRIEEVEREGAERATKAAESARDAANETFSKYSDEKNNQYAEIERKSREKYDRLSRRVTEELHEQRKGAAAAVEDIETEGRHKLRKAEQSREQNSDKSQAAARRKSEESFANIRTSHEAETRDLRQQLRDAVSGQGEHAKGRAEGTAEAIRAHESEVNARERNIVDAYETQIRRQREGSEESQEGRSEKMRSALREQGENNARLLRKQTAEAHAEKKDLTETFDGFRKQVLAQADKDKRMAEERSLQQAELASKRSATALEKQADTSNRTLSEQRQNMLDTQKLLEAKLQEQRTSDDVKLVSPAAEEKIRRAIVNDYEKLARAEADRNARGRDHLEKSANERLHEESAKNEMTMTRLAARGEQDRHLERSQLMGTIEEVEHNRKTSLRDQEASFGRQAESNERKFGGMIEQQRRKYESLLEQTRNDASAKLAIQRQEHEFEDKMAKRAFAARENTLIREYEKRLADQKADHDAVLSETRTKADQAVRDAEKQSKSMLEEVSRGYEQRIAELQFQQKERERFLAQSHQDELDRMKRSNALLIQKKS